MRRSTSTRPRPVSDIERWDDQADVVVVGYGHAGAAAALGAAELTSDVLVLERGGGSEGTCGEIVYLGGGTPMQVAMGWHDTTEDMQTFLRAALGPGVDEDKLQAYCSQSVDHYHWLLSCGVPYTTGADAEGSVLSRRAEDGFTDINGQEYAGGGLIWTGGENAYPFDELTPPVPRGHIQRGGPQEEELQFDGAILKHLQRLVDRMRLRVEYNMSVERLVVDEVGVVAGVEVRTFGETRHLRARSGVVIASGGFIYNDEMLRAHNPALLAAGKLGHGGQDGTGIKMCQSVGADVAHMGSSDLSLLIFPPISFAKGILVNKLGQRFLNEDTYFGRLGAESLREGGRCYLLLDEEIFLESSPRRPSIVADSLDELESECGMPRGALEATVEFYNRNAEDGTDPLFHKRPKWLQPLRPPFGIIDCQQREDSFVLGGFTLGGVRTTKDGAVLDASDDVIHGLFAAGRATSGLAVNGYCSGISLGDGTFFGRRAGRAAASRSR